METVIRGLDPWTVVNAINFGHSAWLEVYYLAFTGGAFNPNLTEANLAIHGLPGGSVNLLAGSSPRHKVTPKDTRFGLFRLQTTGARNVQGAWLFRMPGSGVFNITLSGHTNLVQTLVVLGVTGEKFGLNGATVELVDPPVVPLTPILSSVVIAISPPVVSVAPYSKSFRLTLPARTLNPL